VGFVGKELKVLVNASPLILLAKAGLLRVLKELFGKVWTTKEVWDEVLWPLRHGVSSPDAEAVRACDWVKVIDLTEEEREKLEDYMERLGIDPGEASLAAVYPRGFDFMITADREAEEALAGEGFKVMDLSKLIILAGRRGLLDVRDAAKRIWDAGYRTEEIEALMSGRAP